MERLAPTSQLQQDKLILERRRQQAIKVAKKCIDLLKQQFGATDVILFGSLRGDTPWHWHSDLDLAVQGLSSREIWEAYGEIETIKPSWLTVDLVSSLTSSR